MNQTPSKPDPLLLSAPEVAGLLGCSVRHVWRMADSGLIPRPITLGARLKKWPRSHIDRWLTEQTASRR